MALIRRRAGQPVRAGAVVQREFVRGAPGNGRHRWPESTGPTTAAERHCWSAPCDVLVLLPQMLTPLRSESRASGTPCLDRVAQPAGVAGTDSAAMTSDAGPSGAGPDRAGQHDPARTQRRALTEDHSIRPQDPVVEEVGLQHAPPVHAWPRPPGSPGRSPAASSSPPRRPCRCGRRAPRSHAVISGVPGTAPTSHGTASTSTKVSASSLRHTNDAPQRVLDRPVAAHQQPLGDDRDDQAAEAAGGEQHRRRHSAASTSRAARPQTRPPSARPAPRRAEHRHDPAQLHQPRAPTAAARAGRTYGSGRRSSAARGSFIGGSPS